MSELKIKYFVLSPKSSDPVHAMASRSAIRTYARAIRAYNHEFADELIAWVRDCEETETPDEH